MSPSGYLHSAYAASVAGDGEVIALARSGGHLVSRLIPGSDHKDAKAPHPFLVCSDWSGLPLDLAELDPRLISLTAVTDPFANVDPAALGTCFNRMVVPYKSHFVADLTRPLAGYASTHHCKAARLARRALKVEQCANPPSHLDEWLALYRALIDRHSIKGAALLDSTMLAAQLAVPGLSLFRATDGDETVAMTIWFSHGETAYFHLSASNDAGYRRGASYALVEAAIEHFAANGIRQASLGAVPGAKPGEDRGGLAYFKQGWASGERMTYLCGHVGDEAACLKLSGALVRAADYFPPYRAGEYR